MNEPQTEGPLVEGGLDFVYNSDINIGSLSNIMYSKGLVFAPAETDMSIRPGWFYHPEEEPHSLERLFNTYLTSVGNNATFNLNIPPMPNGKFDPRDVARLKELGELIKQELGQNKAEGAVVKKLPGYGPTQPEYQITLKDKQTVKYVEIAENIREGQRVESFDVFYKDNDGIWSILGRSTTIGSKKIVKTDPTETQEILIRITSSRDVPDIEWIKAY